MITNDALEILHKTEDVVQKSIFSVHEVLNDTRHTKFKMLLIDSLETLKERHEMLEDHLKELQDSTIRISTPLNQNKFFSSIPSSSDRQIADRLFDLCNESVKAIYTYLNHYQAIDKKVKKDIKEAVKAIERLREHLAEYL